MELLIDLVEKRKLLINDISLTAVTDEYMEYVTALKERSLTQTAQFVALAATLLLIKSKSLLPVLQLTDDEADGIENLEERLKLYQIYRNAGAVLTPTFGINLMHEKLFTPDQRPLFVTDRFTKTRALSEALTGLINQLTQKKEPPKVQIKPVILLEEMIDRLLRQVDNQFNSTLRELTEGSEEGSEERATVIVGFLAVLEMVKQGHIEAKQVIRFEDIEIKKESTELPRYL